MQQTGRSLLPTGETRNARPLLPQGQSTGPVFGVVKPGRKAASSNADAGRLPAARVVGGNPGRA